MNDIKFKPVILGIDVGAYSVARTFYEFYNVKSIIIGKYTYWMTDYSKITETHTVDGMKEDKLIDYLVDLKKKYPDTKLLLFGCSEDYVDTIVRNKDVLDKYYVIPTVDLKTLNRVVEKENFYDVCEKVGINYPKTIILNKDNYKDTKIPFKYPIVGKVSNKAVYQRISFEGKMKVFIINSYEELITILDRCFGAGYNDDFVVQEYIKGTDANMRVLTCFCDQNSNVLFSSVGRVLLEEKGPDVTGNYSAIVNTEDEKLVEAAKKFLKETNYKGYANFDVKYDDETKDFYFFEVNVRLGRSNFYMGAGHTNYLEPCVDAYIYENVKDKYEQKGKELYRIIPFCVIKKYVKDKELIKEYKKLKRNNPLDYKKDFSLKRKFYINMALINHIRKFRKYYEK